MSRKLKLTKERMQIIVEGIRNGFTITDVCDMAHIGRSTYYKWLGEFPDFNKAIVEATDLQWKYIDWQMQKYYRGYTRSRLNRPSKYYQSPNNLPFDII